MSELVIIIIIIVLAWTYDFFNSAVLLAALLNIVGALLTTEVAKTIGKGIVDPSIIGPLVVISALIGAVIWVAFCTFSGIPISITHSLVGGIMGAVIVAHGFSVLQIKGLKKIFYAMILSPIADFFIGFIFMLIMIWLFHNAAPHKANRFFRLSQILSTSAVKWGVVLHIVLTWIFTIPGAAFLSALSSFLIDFWVR